MRRENGEKQRLKAVVKKSCQLFSVLLRQLHSVLQRLYVKLLSFEGRKAQHDGNVLWLLDEMMAGAFDVSPSTIRTRNFKAMKTSVLGPARW